MGDASDTSRSLTFDATTLAAHAGCNTMSAPWELGGDTLVVGQLAMTLGGEAVVTFGERTDV